MLGGVLLTSIIDEFAAAMATSTSSAASTLKLHIHSADYPVSQTACIKLVRASRLLSYVIAALLTLLDCVLHCSLTAAA
jgi:hypothetical protein